MKKAYVICKDKNSFPLGIFTTREDAVSFLKFWGSADYIIEEFVIWGDGQDPRQIIHAQTGFTHASYAMKYYGYPEEKQDEYERMDKNKVLADGLALIDSIRR